MIEAARLARTTITASEQNGTLMVDLFLFRGEGSGSARFYGEAVAGKLPVPASRMVAASHGWVPGQGERTCWLLTIIPVENTPEAQ